VASMSAESARALEVLREIWRRTGQTPEGLDDGPDAKTCRRMADAGVGFDNFGASEGADPAAAWRAMLARDGKLTPGGSVRDLVLRPAD
jgi:hypothetical protein